MSAPTQPAVITAYEAKVPLLFIVFSAYLWFLIIILLIWPFTNVNFLDGATSVGSPLQSTASLPSAPVQSHEVTSTIFAAVSCCSVSTYPARRYCINTKLAHGTL